MTTQNEQVAHAALVGASETALHSHALIGHDHETSGQGGKLDHGLALNGLGDDDHPQYVKTSQYPPKLNACAAPDGAVNFNQQQATSLVIENRTSDPGSPVIGQIWLRTDL